MTTNTQTQQQGGGALSTGALMGFRLAQALGWRVGAVALLPLACPALAFGGYVISELTTQAACVEMRGGAYTICRSYSDAYTVVAGAVALGVLFLLAAWGLWRRGGAVRDVELLAERVERPQPAPARSSASTAVIDGVLVK